MGIYPGYKKLREDTDIFSIFDHKNSKDLKIEFLDYNDKMNSEVKSLN